MNLDRLIVGAANECWLWTGTQNRNGYGYASHNGRMRMVHRVVYEIAKGPIPEGLEIDHLCRVRACANPLHLEAVTHRENTLRGDTIPAQHAARALCPKGHEYDRITKQGHRRCLTCSNEAARQCKARRKVARAAV